MDHEPNPLAVIHDEMMVDDLPGAIVRQPGKSAIHSVPGREAVRDQPLGDTAAQHVADRIDDLAHRPGPLAAANGRGGKERAKDRPFGTDRQPIDPAG